MTDIISCVCGYRGAAIVEEGRTVCPLCHGRVKSIEIDPFPDDGRSKRRSFRLPGEDADDDPDVDVEQVTGLGAETDAPVASDADDYAVQAADEIVYHIPCPKGHVLEVRENLLGQQAVCPTCNAFFVLRATDSIEYRREQKRRRQLAEERRAEAWLKVAILAAVIIGLSFVMMIVLALNPGLWRQP